MSLYSSNRIGPDPRTQFSQKPYWAAIGAYTVGAALHSYYFSPTPKSTMAPYGKRKQPYQTPQKSPSRGRTGTTSRGSGAAASSRSVGTSMSPSRQTGRSRSRGRTMSRSTSARRSRARSNVNSVYGGKFAKTKKRSRKTNKFEKDGTVIKIERGSLVSTNIGESLYLGHSFAPNNYAKQFCKCIVKRLFDKAGITVTNFKDSIYRDLQKSIDTPENMRIVWRWRYNDQTVWTTSSAAASLAVANADTVTYEQFANEVLTQMRADIDFSTTGPNPNGPASINTFEFDSFVLMYNRTVSGGNPEQYVISKLDVGQCYIEIDHTSYLTLQNRTNNATGSSDIDTNSINPLVGKRYTTKEWRNGFVLKEPQQVLTNVLISNPLVTNTDVGIIVASSESTEKQLLQKPPPGWLMGSKNTNQVTLMPGELKRDKVHFKAKMKLNTFFQKIAPFFDQTLGGRIGIQMGKAVLFGFETMLYDRTEEIQLNIAYELNQTLKMNITTRKPGCVHTLDIQ